MMKCIYKFLDTRLEAFKADETKAKKNKLRGT